MARYPDIVDHVNLTEGIDKVFNYVDFVTHGIFMLMFLSAILIIATLGIYQKNKDLLASYAIASFSTWVIALLFFLAKVISKQTFGIFLALSIMGYIAVCFPKNET